jgi:hypothetical protein
MYFYRRFKPHDVLEIRGAKNSGNAQHLIPTKTCCGQTADVCVLP